jgi:HAE1 family hydrophobic/amphiphilic exporter-1
VFEYLQEKIKPIEKTGMDVSEVIPELEQYTKIDKD